MLTKEDAYLMAQQSMNTARANRYQCIAHGDFYVAPGFNCPRCVVEGRTIMTFDNTKTHEGDINHG